LTLAGHRSPGVPGRDGGAGGLVSRLAATLGRSTTGWSVGVGRVVVAVGTVGADAARGSTTHARQPPGTCPQRDVTLPLATDSYKSVHSLVPRLST